MERVSGMSGTKDVDFTNSVPGGLRLGRQSITRGLETKPCPHWISPEKKVMSGEKDSITQVDVGDEKGAPRERQLRKKATERPWR